VPDPDALYEVADDVPAMDRPALVVAMSGFVDAGGAARLATEHLLTTLESQIVATFDVDQLLDYRSRRPPLLFVEDHWEHYEAPLLAVRALRDAEGTGFLMLTGPEPDVGWERFVAAAQQLIERFDVRLTIGMDAIPMAVPHTRPIGVTVHATRPDLVAGYDSWLQRVQVPGSAAHLLEYRLGHAGRDAMGFAVHVPHYLAQNDYPAAAQALLASIVKATGLALPTDDLRAAADQVRRDVDEQVGASQEVLTVVHALEEQYDAFVRGREAKGLLAGESGPLPTADELGAELERFLAQRTDRGNDRGNGRDTGGRGGGDAPEG
jgi:predicted ATP-grasp superfamily ATP-dependent carboligase